MFIEFQDGLRNFNIENAKHIFKREKHDGFEIVYIDPNDKEHALSTGTEEECNIFWDQICKSLKIRGLLITKS
ncbi:MAG: hypothetical protein GX421_05245 [Caldisericales bacterium]|nr:hypothetical protein [Caldisericales bacterium]